MNYATIKKHDVANGVGVRVSLFVSGCTHRCKGCFNAEAWDFSFGKEFTEETEREIVEALAPSISTSYSTPFTTTCATVEVSFTSSIWTL